MPGDPYALLLVHSDITLLRRTLPAGEMGRWYPEQRVIVLSPDLTRAEERCTLFHELVHALGDDCGVEEPWLAGRQEKHCHEMVARALIPLERLIAESQLAADDFQLAEALDVDLNTLQIRAETLTASERAVVRDWTPLEDTA